MKVEMNTAIAEYAANNAPEVKTQVKVNEAHNPKEDISEEKVDNIVKKLNTNVDIMSTGIKFEKDSDLGKWIVKVYDDNGTLIRQIPTKEVIQLAKGMEDIMGLIFNKQA